MDRGTIRTEIRDILGELTADFWSDAELNRYINEAQYRFNGEARWPWLISEGTGTLTASNPNFALPAGVPFPRSINITLTKSGDSKMYQPVRVSPTKGWDLRARHSTTTTASYPRWFYVTAATSAAGTVTYVIRFIPTPNSNMTVDYQYLRRVSDLTTDAAVPDMPVEYHKALVHYAAGTAWLKELNGAQKAREQFELYRAVVEQAKREFFAEPDDEPLVIGKDEPQLGRLDEDPWMLRIPDTLGP